VSVSIEVRRVGKRFGTVEAIGQVDLDVRAGETLTLIGPSGCGKTTLLRLIAGLEICSTGSITIDGLPVDRARRAKKIGFVPQSPALLPWRTVDANARLLLDINPTRSATSSRGIDELLDAVGLSGFGDAYPHELSGGMQQRVALVRALALDAPVLLMDEPFAALDEITRTEMRHLLDRVCAPLRTTIVFVTHSISEAAFLSDRVAVMSPRPGRIASIIDVGLPRPRRPEVEDTVDYFEVTTTLRRALHDGSAT